MMKVCHRWRDTLTHCNNLWSVIDDKMFDNKTLYPPYFRPNSTTNVSVYVSGTGSNQTRKLLREYPECVVELRVSDLGISPSRSSKLVTFAATRLLICTLAEITLARKPGTLKLFNGHAPRLRALWLKSVYFIPSNSFPSLQHLIIAFPYYDHYQGIPPKGPYTLTQFLTFLRGCACLKTLYLLNVGCQRVREIPGAVDDESRVSLPQLQKLSVHEEFRHASKFQVAIFAHLDLSPDCLIYICAVSAAHLQPLMNAVAGSSSRRLSTMQLCADSGSRLCPEPIQLADDQGSQILQIDIPYRYYDLEDPYERDEVGQMWCSELFRGIKTLRTAPLPFLLLLQYPHDILSNLESLAISIRHEQVVSGLSALTPGLGDRTACPLKFPKLATLCLPEIALADLPGLYTIVESRRMAGHPIKHLAVSLDATSDELTVDQLYAMNELRGLLAEHFIVTWTGKDKSKDRDAQEHSLPAEFAWTYPEDCTYDSDWNSWEFWPAWSTLR